MSEKGLFIAIEGGDGRQIGGRRVADHAVSQPFSMAQTAKA